MQMVYPLMFTELSPASYNLKQPSKSFGKDNRRRPYRKSVVSKRKRNYLEKTGPYWNYWKLDI